MKKKELYETPLMETYEIILDKNCLQSSLTFSENYNTEKFSNDGSDDL